MLVARNGKSCGGRSVAVRLAGDRKTQSVKDEGIDSAFHMLYSIYSLIQTKCQGGNKYALPITVKFDQSTRKFGRISLHACSG